MPANTVTLLSLNSRREPQKHQFYKGFKNVAYLAGYFYDIRGNTIYLQMTNNINLVLPVTIPPGIKMPSNFKRNEALKMVCQVRAFKEEDGSPGLRVYARSFERPNVLELPLRSAFEKQVPARAQEDTVFKPYGAGHRQKDACNQVHLAGMVVEINQRSVHLDEDGGYVQSAAVDFLLRQDDDEKNVIPVRYYGKLADQIASNVKRGDLILTSGKYRVKPIEKQDADSEKPEVVAKPYIHIDPPQQPSEFEILYMSEGQEFPRWMIDLHSRFKLGQRRQRPAAEAPAANAEKIASPTADDSADFEKHPKWATLSEEDKAAARASADVRRHLLNT